MRLTCVKNLAMRRNSSAVRRATAAMDWVLKSSGVGVESEGHQRDSGGRIPIWGAPQEYPYELGRDRQG